MAITAAAGLIAATPPTPAQSDQAVTHRAVALAAVPIVAPARAATRKQISDYLPTIGATVAVVAGLVSGPVGVVSVGVALVWSQREWLAKPIAKAAEELKRQILPPQFDRAVDAVTRVLSAQGGVITTLLHAQRTANLTNLDKTLTTLQGRLERRQKLTDAEFERAKLNLSKALGEVSKTLGVQLHPGQVNSWFDQAEGRFDNNFDKLEAAVQTFHEVVTGQLNSPQQSASGLAKPSAAARSARQAGKPTATNRTGTATKSTSAHARSPRAGG
ncbi:hypothetical protein [Mycolicibacterium sarraceniae]|uniref:Uncharacterized protein n=1 Tax=Mycolicibacterium sarraceniae TaxID=1534348 RepID=A0A7I7SNY7_9MYCO|nr:hypothetical protein [Mycolicibacterium sarraceniae]BBY57939.1 hypothetical protein MSAR_10750 [Mycolicibacterium sarraceniae]